MKENNLGAAIRQAREEKGFSQEKLAEYVEVSRQAVSKWEKGLAVPTEDNLKRLEGALDLPAGTLSELPHTEDTPAQKSNVKSPKHLALFALLLLAASAGSFALGRSTAPLPESTEPETKLIWQMTESHHTVNPAPDELEARNTYDNMGRPLRLEGVSPGADPTVVTLEESVYDEAGNRIKHTMHRDGELCWDGEAEYDTMGNQIVYRSLNADGTVDYWVEFGYDDHGNQTTYQSFNTQGELEGFSQYSYTYFEDGSYERDYFHPAGENSVYWHAAELFDAYGNLLEYTRYDMDGNILKSSQYVYQSFEVPVDFNPPG